MRKFLTLGALMGLLAFVTASAQAQLLPLGGPSGGGIFLLMNKGVQAELKITEDQQSMVREKARSIFERIQENLRKLKDVPEAEKPEQARKLAKELEEIASKLIADILKPEQMKRLKQIQRQQSVASALLNDEEVGKALDFSAEQKEKIKAVNEELHKEVESLRQQFTREALEKINAAHKEANEKALKTLSDAQQKKWKELIGAPFEVKLDGFARKKKDK